MRGKRDESGESVDPRVWCLEYFGGQNQEPPESASLGWAGFAHSCLYKYLDFSVQNLALHR